MLELSFALVCFVFITLIFVNEPLLVPANIPKLNELILLKLIFAFLVTFPSASVVPFSFNAFISAFVTNKLATSRVTFLTTVLFDIVVNNPQLISEPPVKLEVLKLLIVIICPFPSRLLKLAANGT